MTSRSGASSGNVRRFRRSSRTACLRSPCIQAGTLTSKPATLPPLVTCSAKSPRRRGPNRSRSSPVWRRDPCLPRRAKHTRIGEWSTPTVSVATRCASTARFDRPSCTISSPRWSSAIGWSGSSTTQASALVNCAIASSARRNGKRKLGAHCREWPVWTTPSTGAGAGGPMTSA